jgi:hypothetical protein
MPPWQLARDTDFLRSFGHVARREGSHTPWTGEDRFCRATHALRFAMPLRSQRLGSLGEQRSGFMCHFRGLLATDPTGMFRFEVLLARDRPQPANAVEEVPLSPSGLVELLEAIWGLDVLVGPTKRTRRATLIKSGPALAQHLLQATTAKEPAGPAPQKWWVGNGGAVTIVEYQPGEVAPLPPAFQPIELTTTTGLALYHYNGAGGPVFLAKRQSPWSDKDEINRLYLHLLRLHTEVETFFGLSRLMLLDPPRLSYGDPSTRSDLLARYLKNSLKILTGRFLTGYETDGILADAFRVHRRVSHEEYEALLGIFADFDSEISDSFGRLIAQGLKNATGLSGVSITINERGAVDESIHISAGGDITNSGLIGSHNYVKDSFQRIEQGSASDELKADLKELIVAIAALAPQVPDASVGEQLARDVQSFSDEASATTPRKPMLQAFGDQIVSVAKVVGQYGLPVIGLITKILGFF